MADLSSLLKYAPTTAAGFMGINQAQNEQMQVLKQRELAELMSQRNMEAQQKAAMHPLELEAKRLGIRKGEAELPGIMADAEGKQLDTRKKATMFDSDVSAAQLKNNMEMQRALMTELGTIGVELEGVSPLERPQRFAQALEQRGFPQAQGLLRRFSNIPPDKLPAALSALSQAHLRNNPEFVREMEKEKLQQAGADRRNAATIAGQKGIKQMEIDAGKYNRKDVAVSVQARLLKARNSREKAEVLEEAYYAAISNDDMQAAQVYKTRAMEARQRAAEEAEWARINPNAADMNQFDLRTVPPPVARAPIAGGGAAPQPQPPRSPSNGPFTDAEKERRYQAWKAAQQGK